MIRRPPRSTRRYTLFPYTTLFRSERFGALLDRLGIRCPEWGIVEDPNEALRSEEHTSELQSRNDNSYAGICMKKKKQHTTVYQSIRSPRSQRKSSLLPLV